MTTLHLNIWQTIALSLLQGLTELFPISSLGHTVILPGLLPGLFGPSNLQTDTSCGGQSCFLPIITALHIGTSIALVIYFWRDWWQVILTLLKSIKEGEVRTGTDEWVSFLIIIGVVPAGLIGVTLETPLKQLFTSPVIAAAFLVDRKSTRLDSSHMSISYAVFCLKKKKESSRWNLETSGQARSSTSAFVLSVGCLRNSILCMWLHQLQTARATIGWMQCWSRRLWM